MKPASASGPCIPTENNHLCFQEVLCVGSCGIFFPSLLQPAPPSLSPARRASTVLHFWETMDKKQGRCCNFQNTWWGRVKG